MKKNANEYDNTFIKNIARVAVILIVIFVVLYSDRKPSGNLDYEDPDAISISERTPGINADTISSLPETVSDVSSSAQSSSAESHDEIVSEITGTDSEALLLLIPNDRIHIGELALIDEKHQCLINGDDYTLLGDEMNSAYRVMDDDILINDSVIKPLNEMMRVFMNKYNNSRMAVANGYISYDEQNDMFELQGNPEERLELDSEVEKAGFSEHQTGYALDLCIYDKTNERYDKYTPYGDFSWIGENCHKYGFITRYDEDKESITSKPYQPWHLRYVGTAHACAMKYNDFCLEEYLDYVKQFTYDGNHLKLTDADKENWDIYYVPADTENADGETLVTVPKNSEYSISGDNVGGFIVTVKS